MKAVDRELRLRRLTVDEALWQLDQYLYDAFMAGLPSVRIVHGKGTGKLRHAVHKSLAGILWLNHIALVIMAKETMALP